MFNSKFLIMATNAKTNGQSKTETATTKVTVQKKLANEASGKAAIPVTKETAKPNVNLDERITRFEKLRGLANQRERLNSTLSELTRFNYNQDGSSTFFLRDAAGLEFKTINSNLIKLVTSHLQHTLEVRKAELEKELIEFEL